MSNATINELTPEDVAQVSGGDETQPSSSLKDFYDWLCAQFR